MTSMISKLALIVTALVLSTTMAMAGTSLDAAKANGWIGEKSDGLLGIVSTDTPADVREQVQITNSERMLKYNQIARSNQTTLPKVQALAGEKIIKSVPYGQYIRISGAWEKK